jgi:polyisoprenoid-binding protein YceI
MYVRTITALLVTAAVATGSPRAEPLPITGEVHVRVWKRGLFSGFAHDHDFEVTRWTGSIDPGSGGLEHASLKVTIAADSLRDREEGLSGGDRKKVDAQAAGPGVLHAAEYPEIEYVAEGLALEPGSDRDGPLRGTIHGTLALRGKTRPVDATFEATRESGSWRAKGRARFRQSDFGIEPFSGFGGTVKVKDEIEVRFDVKVPART